MTSSKDRLYGYYINLDERGDFYADVRDAGGKTVYEIHAGASLEENEASIFEDGFMRHKEDVAGLAKYLCELGVISREAEVLPAMEFERRVSDSIPRRSLRA